MMQLLNALLSAALSITKMQYIIIAASSAGGVLLLLIFITALRMRKYHKKLAAYRAQTQEASTDEEPVPEDAEAYDEQQEYWDPQQETQYDEYGQPYDEGVQQYDEYGQPYAADQQYDEYGQPYDPNMLYDEYGQPYVDPYGQPYDPYAQPYGAPDDRFMNGYGRPDGYMIQQPVILQQQPEPAAEPEPETPQSAIPFNGYEQEPIVTVDALANARLEEASNAVRALIAAADNEKKATANYLAARATAASVAQAKKKTEVISLRTRLRAAETMEEATSVLDAVVNMDNKLTPEEKDNKELKALIDRTIDDANRVINGDRRRSGEPPRREPSVRSARSTEREERQSPRRRSSGPAYFDDTGRAVYYDEFGRAYYREPVPGGRSRPSERARERSRPSERAGRAIDRDRAEKERLYRERQRRLRERDGLR